MKTLQVFSTRLFEVQNVGLVEPFLYLLYAHASMKKKSQRQVPAVIKHRCKEEESGTEGPLVRSCQNYSQKKEEAGDIGTLVFTSYR